MADLVFNLQQMVLSGESTTVGFEFYQGGQVHDQNQNNRLVGTYVMLTDTINGVTAGFAPLPQLDTGALKLQLFAESQRQGQGHGRQITETIVLEGAPTVLGGTPPAPAPAPAQPTQGRPVIQAFGSVSAATPMWQDRIGHQWTLINNVLTIH